MSGSNIQLDAADDEVAFDEASAHRIIEVRDLPAIVFLDDFLTLHLGIARTGNKKYDPAMINTLLIIKYKF
jgi:hypothetical protein